MKDNTAQAGPRNIFHRFTRWNRLGILAARVFKLLKRYGLTEAGVRGNFDTYIRILSRHQAGATFPTTAVTLARHPEMMRRLREEGIELAIHGYTHIDYSRLDFESQNNYISRAIEAFNRIGITPTGLRCPYLWWNEDTRKAAGANGLKYVSNQVFVWDAYDTPEVRSLYHIRKEPPKRSLPRIHDGLVEIPISLPDDFILAERIGLKPDRVAEIWTHILDTAAKRNQMLTLQIHPELILPCARGLEAVLTNVRAEPDRFWCATLDEAASWWLARYNADVTEIPSAGGFTLDLHGPEEAIWLLTGHQDNISDRNTNGCRRIQGEEFHITGNIRPFVAVSASAPPEAVIELKEEGYIIRRGVDSPDEYAVFLDDAVLGSGSIEDWIEIVSSVSRPLIKCAKWPGDRQAALVVTGDLDCVTLFDYAWRLAGR